MAHSYPAFPVFSFLGFILALIPLPWHLEAWNSATCYYMIWASLACLNKFINSLVWADNALNPSPVWCDLSTRIIIGASVGIPAASLCINRRLYLIARIGAVTVTKAEKRRAILVDSLVCVLFPIVCMALAYVVQGHRFNIYEEVGCYPAIYNTLLAYFLVNWWPVVLGLISAVYCILSLHAFGRRRVQFREFLSSNNSSLTFGRYFRLMALATTELLLTIPISSYSIYLNATAQPIETWVSWSYVHYAFSRVEQVPSLVWRTDGQLVTALELGQWLNPVCALVFFAYFGLAEEARRHYKAAFWSTLKLFGFSPAKQSFVRPFSSKLGRATNTASSEVLPAYSASLSASCQSSTSHVSSFTEVREKPTHVELADSPYSPGEKHESTLPASPISPSSTLSPDSPLNS